jgi:hypothetical protein
MNLVSQTTKEQQAGLGPAAQQFRKDRLLLIVEKGLPPFPAIVLELTKILSGPDPDIKKAGRLIRSDPSLSSQLLRLCNSPLFGLRSRVISIEQAAVLVGANPSAEPGDDLQHGSFRGKHLATGRACFLLAP